MIRNKELFRNRLFPIGGREASPPARVGFAAGPDPSDDTRIPIALFCRISGQGTSTRNLETFLCDALWRFRFACIAADPSGRCGKGKPATARARELMIREFGPISLVLRMPDRTGVASLKLRNPSILKPVLRPCDRPAVPSIAVLRCLLRPSSHCTAQLNVSKENNCAFNPMQRSGLARGPNAATDP